MNNRLIARIARQGGGKLLDLAVGRLFPDKPEAKVKKKLDPTKAITGAVAGAALTRFATRSVPGAIVVGGGILAKKLYDRRKARKAEAEKQATPPQMGDWEADDADDDQA